MRNIVKSRKAAFELSMTTVVVIVISMLMLILGITLVQKVFQTGYNVVDITDKKTTDAINKYLTIGAEEELQFYLPGNTAEISQGTTFGVAFRFSPLKMGTYKYETKIAEIDTSKCGTISSADETIGLGKSGLFGTVNSGENKYGLIKITVPKEYPLDCEIRYVVTITGTSYTTSSNFDMKVVRKKVAGMF